MKILIVIDSLGSGGAQRLKANLAKSLSNRGHQVEIFIYQPSSSFYLSDFQSSNIKVNTVNKEKKGFSFYVLMQLRDLILKNNYDGVISSMHVPSIYAAFAKLGIKKGKLIVCEESSSNAPVHIFKKILFYLSALIANSVVANSVNETKLLKRWFGLSNKVHTIWNGFKIPKKSVSQNIVENELSNLLVVARVAYPKNGVNLLKALSVFYSRHGWVPKVDWAGRRDGDIRSLEMQENMDQYLLEHPEISSNWKWLGEVKDVEELYKKSDALILVSIYEGLPLVICEAMIAGCFVIASRVCDHPLIIGDDERGFLCDPLSPESICDSIERLCSLNATKKVNILKNARKFAELNFNQDSMAASFETLLSS